MKLALRFFTVLFFLLPKNVIHAQDTLAYWPLNESIKNTTKELISNTSFNISTVKKNIEIVPAAKNNGLRTDGYSTFINGKLLRTVHVPFSISGWFALETYPTDTASFFALNDEQGNYISACINEFGKPIIGSSTNNNKQYVGADITLQKFKWIFVCLNVELNKAELFINGKKLQTISICDSSFTNGFNEIYIGRDKRSKFVNIFPVTAINGLMDEIVIENKILTTDDFKKFNLQQTIASRPNLNIPDIRFKDDFDRPKYHLLPAANWTNETHGLIYYKGLYHIFNQKNGSNLFLGQMNWGHFISKNLIHWTERKPALTPAPGYDELGDWSGHCVLNDAGIPTIIYTGGNPNYFGMCLAEPLDDSLLAWKKYAGNPVIKSTPKQYTRTDFHDPYLFKANNIWYMIVGFGIKENDVEKGTVLLYKSTNLKSWKFLHPLFVGDPKHDSSGVFWEMPVFWKINDKYILLVNKTPQRNSPAVALYWVGDFKNEKFIPDNLMPQKLELVNRLLSPSVALDKFGSTVAIGIIPDETSAKAQYAQGWTHLFSIPRLWTLRDNKIIQQPYPGLIKLRTTKTIIQNKNISRNDTLTLSKGTNQLEIKATLLPQNCKRFGFMIEKNIDGSEYSGIYYDFDKKQFIINQTHSTQREDIPLNIRAGNYDLKQNEKVDLHIFIDGSVVEVFINNKDAFTTRIFPLHKTSDEVQLFADGKLKLISAQVWKLKSSENNVRF